MFAPGTHRVFGGFYVELAAAFINGKEGQRIELGPPAVTIMANLDQFLIKQFPPCFIECVAGFPAAFFHGCPCNTQIAIVKAFELRREVNQQLDRGCGKTDVNLTFQKAVR